MSGHSKWSQIKRQKGAADQKRGQVFGRLTNAIIIASKVGADPNTNFTLKMAIERAKAASMPKENIERAIQRGSGKLGGAVIEEVTYEAIGPEKIGIIIEALTDNKNRTTSQVKNILTKFNAKMTGSGTVSYQFERMGKVLVDLVGKDRDELELSIIDAGAQDFDEQENSLVVYTKPNELEMVKKNLEEKDISAKETLLVWEPKSLVSILDKDKGEKILSLMEALDNLEDVVSVFSNFDLPNTPITNQSE